MAWRGHVFDDHEILKLADNGGWTVAHRMAWRGHVFDDPEILKLADNDGRTVADICDKRHPEGKGKYNKILQLLKQKEIEEQRRKGIEKLENADWEELINNAPRMF